ncbi:MAG: hypothetical protein NTV34_10590 [Proteobacteria bacterium]|nr:hypothetical protein [Pseudomonadota bacterium]
MNTITWYLFSALLLAACATNRAPSSRMLDARAGYDEGGDKPLDVTFAPSEDKVIPKRSAPVIADTWVHPNELATGDYFLGGWIRSIVKEPHWTTAGGLDHVFKPVTKPLRK